MPGGYLKGGLLQWGLTLSSKETRQYRGIEAFFYMASMGPYSFEQGNSQHLILLLPCLSLQWGLTLSSKETSIVGVLPVVT